MAWSGGHGEGSQLLPISRRTLALYLLLFLFPIPLDYLKKLLLLIICFFQRRGLLLPVTAVLSCASLFPTCFDFFLLLIAGPFCPSVRLKAEKRETRWMNTSLLQPLQTRTAILPEHWGNSNKLFETFAYTMLNSEKWRGN